MLYFEILFLKEAERFINALTFEEKEKLFRNIAIARTHQDPKLFKKLNQHIWEFRTKYNGKQLRLFAFWDKTNGPPSLVVATHGLIKKTGKTPGSELKRAMYLRDKYFNDKK